MIIRMAGRSSCGNDSAFPPLLCYLFIYKHVLLSKAYCACGDKAKLRSKGLGVVPPNNSYLPSLQIIFRCLLQEGLLVDKSGAFGKGKIQQSSNKGKKKVELSIVSLLQLYSSSHLEEFFNTQYEYSMRL